MCHVGYLLLTSSKKFKTAIDVQLTPCSSREATLSKAWFLSKIAAQRYFAAPPSSDVADSEAAKACRSVRNEMQCSATSLDRVAATA